MSNTTRTTTRLMLIMTIVVTTLAYQLINTVDCIGNDQNNSSSSLITINRSNDTLIIYVKPSLNISKINCSDVMTPCSSIENALNFAASQSSPKVLLYLMSGRYNCNTMLFYTLNNLKKVEFESFDKDRAIFDCENEALFQYTIINAEFSFSKIDIVNAFIMNDSILKLSFYDCFLKLVRITFPQFLNKREVLFVNCEIDNIEIYNSHTTSYFNSTISNTRNLPSHCYFFSIYSCTLDHFYYSNTQQQFVAGNEFSIRNSIITNSEFNIRRKQSTQFSFNTFHGANTLQVDRVSSILFVDNQQNGGSFSTWSRYSEEVKMNLNIFKNINNYKEKDIFLFEYGIQFSITSSTFESNSNSLRVHDFEIMSINYCSFRNNSKSLVVDSEISGATSIITASQFNYNGKLTNEGGGAYLKSKNVQIRGTSFVGNKALRGGGLYIESKEFNLEIQRCDNNTAVYGGGAYLKLTRGVERRVSTWLSGNTAKFGGGLYIETVPIPILFSYLRCDNNIAEFSGGCIYFSTNTLQIGSFFGLYLNRNIAGSYGDFIGQPFSNVSYEMDVNIGDERFFTRSVDSNEELWISLYPGQKVIATIKELKTSLLNQQVGVKYLENPIDFTLFDNDGVLYGKKQISPKQISLYIALATVYARQPIIKGMLKLDSIVQNISIIISECPSGTKLMNPLNSGFVCLPDEVKFLLTILIPILVLLTVIVIIVLSVITFKITIYIIKNLKLLKKKQVAEKLLEAKVIEKSLIFSEMRQPLLINSVNHSNSSGHTLIIPIEDLTIVKKIGEGGNGTVYLAKWKFLSVALKTLKSEDIIDEDNYEEFEREAAILNSLSHPSIVKMYGISATSSQKYMVVEFVSNGSLDKLIYQSRLNISYLNLKTKLKILIDVADGMKYLHTLNPPIIHRDLKPGNILITEDFKAKVADFGLSTNRYSASTKNIGTLCYQPNEMVEDGHKYTTKVDVYSFGIILWELFFEEHCYFNSRSYKIHRFTSYQGVQISEYNLLLHVLKGLRPKIPFNTSEEMQIWLEEFLLPKCTQSLSQLSEFTTIYMKIMQQCWDKNPDARPSFSEILQELISLQNLLI